MVEHEVLSIGAGGNLSQVGRESVVVNDRFAARQSPRISDRRLGLRITEPLYFMDQEVGSAHPGAARLGA